jgi:hypothetical protein
MAGVDVEDLSTVNCTVSDATPKCKTAFAEKYRQPSDPRVGSQGLIAP